MLINSWLENNFEKIVSIRRWLHQHPEVGFNEYKTSKYCKKNLAVRIVIHIGPLGSKTRTGR